MGKLIADTSLANVVIVDIVLPLYVSRTNSMKWAWDSSNDKSINLDPKDDEK